MVKSIFYLGLDSILQFESIARLKSLKLAAEELHLSQPAVTQALRKLESKIGAPLCLRSRSAFQLTEAGHRLYQSAKGIRDEIESYSRYLISEEDFDGIFSIGVIDNFKNSHVEHTISKVIERFPKMKIDLQVYSANEVQDLLVNGEIEFGFGIFNAKRDELNYRVVGSETIHNYISESHPLWKKKKLSITDLQGMARTWVDIISRRRSKIESEVFNSKRQKSHVFSSYTNNLNTATMLLSSGRSIVAVPAEYLETRKLDFKYRTLDEVLPPYSLKQEMAFLRDRVNGSPCALAFLDLIRENKS